LAVYQIRIFIKVTIFVNRKQRHVGIKERDTQRMREMKMTVAIVLMTAVTAAVC